MAVVLPSEDDGYFAPSLRRSQSQTKFLRPAGYSLPAKLDDSYDPTSKSSSESDPSSAPSSPRTAHVESTDLSYVSTPASNLSIASEYDESPEDHFVLPPYEQEKIFNRPDFPMLGDVDSDDELPKGSLDQASQEPDSDGTSRPDSPNSPDKRTPAEDDTAVASKPSRQVDYLSHNWAEEDIWTSWRYIVSKRGEFSNSARLENASWRTWMKAKNNLKTISPESLNWLKDCDVTWLYGPLQSRPSKLYESHTEPSSSSMSKTESLVNMATKKPILKKRTMSEIMLQHSLSSASLLKQAAASIHAQQEVSDPEIDFAPVSFASRHLSIASASTVESTDSSTLASPCAERRHIHFNEQVEQCIAIDVKGDDEDEDIDMDMYCDESDSEEGVMMKHIAAKKRGPRRKTPKRGIDGKIIAKLPSTKLKYREDTPEPRETAMRHSRSPVISPSSSQETLRPTRQKNRFYFDEEDDEDMDDETSSPRSGWRSPPGEGGLQRSSSTGSLQDAASGLRRTSSGMLMPCEDLDAAAGDGILGRVIDTVNTARDIAHVIWNVGWRK